MLQRNDPNLNFSARVNPIWGANSLLKSNDDELIEVDDFGCPTIILSAREKHRLREL